MIPRLTFRQWSMAVSLGENGIKMMLAQRALRRNVMDVQQAALRDAMVHGIGIYRSTINMGEGCTPVFKRIDPSDVYVDRMVR